MNRYPEYVSSGSYWFDEIPSHWEKTRNKFIFYSDKSTVGDEWGEFDLLTMGKEGVRLRDMDGGGKFPESFGNYQIVKPNQLIFCLFDIDETPRTVGFSNLHGMITSAYDIFSCKNNVNPKFVNYFYQSIDDVKGLRPYYTGLRKVVRSDTFMGINIYIPPLQEQNLISKYLDKKTSQIDSLIKKIEQKIELLKEQRSSLVNQCVTKGLNPDVEMKDSGVEWIGKIPTHWDLIQPKYILNRVTRPIEDDDETITCFRDGQVTLRKNRREDGFTNSTKEHGYQQIRPGDLVIHEMDGFAGAIGISDSKGKSTPVYTVIEPDEKTDLRFVVYLLREMSRSGKIQSLARSIRERTTDFRWRMWSGISFCFPPLQEQVLISSYLDRKTSQIRSLVEKETERIELLKEYRQSLISNVVTGKVRITEEMI